MSHPSSDRYTDPEVDYDAIFAAIDVENFTPSKSGSTSDANMCGVSGKMEMMDPANDDEGDKDQVGSVTRKMRNTKRTSVADLLRNRREDGVTPISSSEKVSHGIKRDRTSSRSFSQNGGEYAELNVDPSPSNKRPRATERTSTSCITVKQPPSSSSKGLGNLLFEWSPPSKTMPVPTSSTLHAHGIRSSTISDNGAISNGAPPGMGGYIQSRVGRLSREQRLKESKRGHTPVEAKEFKNDEEVNTYLLTTLGKEGNPITNSDLYSRTAHVISASTGHQVSNRGAAKFSMPNQTYMQRRNEKLKEQFLAKRDHVVASGSGIGNEGTGANDSEENNGGSVGGGSEIAAGGIGKGNAFDDWIVGGKRPKRIGIGDVQSSIFAGCTIYINGYTGPRTSDLELKRLIAMHGGNVSYHCTSACTHILVATGLSGTKSQKFLDASSSTRKGKRKVVHIDWALDSVVQGKKLSETGYNVIANKAQPTLFSSLDKGPLPPSGVVDDPIAKGIRDRHAGVRHREIVIMDD